MSRAETATHTSLAAAGAPVAPATTPFAKVSETYRQAAAKNEHAFERVWLPKGVSSDAFGLKIAGDCLARRAKDGQFVIVESQLPEPGDLAVIWLKGRDTPITKILTSRIHGYPAHPDSECFTLVYLEQLNPPSRFCVSLDKVECIARVHSIVRAKGRRQ
jgi:hypothetical protein